MALGSANRLSLEPAQQRVRLDGVQALALGGISQLETDAYMKHRLYLTGYQPGVGLSIKNTRKDKNRDGKWSSFLMLIPHCQRLSFTEKDQGSLGCSNSQGAVID